jgi:acyl-coenzyme A thioesterase PaaI-like protein
VTAERLVHHELCFGCGRTNLFGLLMEIEPTGDGKVRGRGFVKQDHQGAVRGTAHDGIVVAALSEAMSFAAGGDAGAASLELKLEGAVPVGMFLDVEAHVSDQTPGEVVAIARASVSGQTVATARGAYPRR